MAEVRHIDCVAIRHEMINNADDGHSFNARHSGTNVVTHTRRGEIIKSISTGTGIALLAGAIVAYPILDRVMPKADASATQTAAVAAASIAQVDPTIVWCGTLGGDWTQSLYRAWSDGRVEMRRVKTTTDAMNDWPSAFNLWCSAVNPPCASPWFLLSDPSDVYSFRSDIDGNGGVDGAVLGSLLAAWGDAPRHDIPPSDCPLNLINP